MNLLALYKFFYDETRTHYLTMFLRKIPCYYSRRGQVANNNDDIFHNSMDSQIPINLGDCTYIPPSKQLWHMLLLLFAI